MLQSWLFMLGLIHALQGQVNEHAPEHEEAAMKSLWLHHSSANNVAYMQGPRCDKAQVGVRSQSQIHVAIDQPDNNTMGLCPAEAPAACSRYFAQA